MSNTNYVIAPYKKAVFLPIFILFIFAGSVLFAWGGTTIYRELEARRDARAFSQGQYDSVAWVEFTAQNENITHQDLSARFYNDGMILVASANADTDTGDKTYIFVAASYRFQSAFLEAEKKNDTQMMAKASSAAGSVLLRAALGYQDVSLLEKADVMLVRALKFNPNDHDARWNLELLRRFYNSDTQQKPGDNDDKVTGPGKIDPGQGGL